MQYPQPGDKVALIAPSYALPAGTEEETLGKACALLGSWGYEAVPYYDQSREHNFAGMRFEATPEQRAETLYAALSNPDIKAVMALRGGFGALEVVQEMYKNPDKYPPLSAEQAKPVIGFSDITAIHLFLNQVWGWPSIHGEVITRLVKTNPDAVTLAKTQEALRGEFLEPYHLEPLNEAARNHQEITVPLTGGNMAVLQYFMGTPLGPDFRNKALFLEDTGEPVRKIHGRLLQLAELYVVGVEGSQQRVMDTARAIIFGDFLNEENKVNDEVTNQILDNFASQASKVNVPVYRLAGVGHGNVNLPLIFGLPVTISDCLLHFPQSCGEAAEPESRTIHVDRLSAEALAGRAI